MRSERGAGLLTGRLIVGFTGQITCVYSAKSRYPLRKKVQRFTKTKPKKTTRNHM